MLKRGREAGMQPGSQDWQRLGGGLAEGSMGVSWGSCGGLYRFGEEQRGRRAGKAKSSARWCKDAL
jgi:hypothetical protein